MSNINILNRKDASEEANQLLSAVEKQLGGVPNIFLAFAHSPGVLEGYLQFSGALAKGKLSPKVREQIALATAGINSCDYCASAHTVLGKKAGLSEAELQESLKGFSADSRTEAILNFVTEVVENRGFVQDDSIGKLDQAGLSMEEIVEVVGNIGINMFTNYFNHIAGTEIDFPLVKTGGKQACNTAFAN